MDDEVSAGVTLARALVNQAWSSPMSYEPLWKARRLLENLLKVEQDHLLVLTCLGAVLCDLHLRTEAQAVLEQAARLGSTDRNTYFNLFVAMLGNATQQEARAALEQGVHLERDASSWEAYFDPHAQ
ncbi:UDP-N-acetylglucosamine-peptide N-acetylglucosaminyltransferase [Dyella silvatica]|uniref:UDP-N-acetylglucosamine-peptide N-acetylglucosaminyltransferase n=1 Tax=Dyella silvatica TaxID=2992128 RepID=UPI002257EE92|nr:UDP-N-acetylglucosamine-peptide N-acetylglucosaminyltransferase [Dyella silvatica]